MKIGITTFGGDGGKSGISRYIMSLLKEFVHFQEEHNFEVLLYENERDIFLPEGNNFRVLTFPESLRPAVKSIFWHQTSLPSICKKQGYDVMFLPAANRRACLRLPCPMVGTVHDFSSLHVKGKYDPARLIYIRQVLPYLSRRLTEVLTVSESSKRDLVEFAKVPAERVTVTPLAADFSTYHPTAPDGERERLIQQYNLQPPYLLYTSRLEHPGKNHVNLIKAFEQLVQQKNVPHQLVLAGSDWSGSEEIHGVAQESSVKDRIRFTGFVPTNDLPGLYRHCEVFVFPSLYEGFGLPILEAMACGAPVACSNVSSMPEVAGNAAIQFNPESPDSIATAIAPLLLDPEMRSLYSTKGLARSAEFTWSHTAEQTLDVLKRAAQTGVKS
jgi:glycosyltransferase involved in cell wall biosynthesis